MPRASVIWDLEDDPDGNVQHIAEHGLTKDEVEHVLQDDATCFAESESSGFPIAFGWTHTGRYIVVVFEEIEDDPWSVRPVTAYETPPPTERGRRKGKRRGR